MHFRIRWPDGTPERCYSPSLVVKDFFAPGETLALDAFVARSRAALTVASDRVAARYGFPCRLALGQIARIEAAARRFADRPDAQVSIDGFEE